MGLAEVRARYDALPGRVAEAVAAIPPPPPPADEAAGPLPGFEEV